MIDVETLGLRPNAALLSLGAVVFGRDQPLPTSLHPTTPTFYAEIELSSCLAAGLTVDAKTIAWWATQGAEARRASLGMQEGRWSLAAALRQFSEFVNSLPPLSGVWGNGAAFDNVVLREAYRSIGCEPPWDYRQDRCYRTLRNLNRDVFFGPFVGTEHNALDDAVAQARHATEILRSSPGVHAGQG
jgi:DNA polymerase III epsilon subunit-like protein